jgi:hypothetical protein
MKNKIAIVTIIAAVMFISCTAHKSPTAITSDPVSESSTAVAQVTDTAVALQTAGPAAQATATAAVQETQTQGAILTLTATIGTPTKTASATRTVTPTITCTKTVAPNTPTAIATFANKFRIKTLSGYDNSGILATTMVFSYATGATPTAMTAYLYDSYGNVTETSQVTFDISGNTLSVQSVDSYGNVLTNISSDVTVGLVTKQYIYFGTVYEGYNAFQYNAAGKITREDVYNASGTLMSSVVNAYNAQGFLTRTDNYSGSTLESSTVNIYDSSGIKLLETDGYSSGTLQEKEVFQFNACGPSGAVIYDGSGVAEGSATMQYNAQCEPTSEYTIITSGSMTLSFNATLTYDSNNNMTDISMTFTFNGTSHTTSMGMTWEAY